MRRPKLAEHELYGYQVVLIDTRPTVPVFHKWGRFYVYDPGPGGESVTPCGEWFFRVRPEPDDPDRTTTLTRGFGLDPRHALKFARPCKVCYHGGVPEHLDIEDES